MKKSVWLSCAGAIGLLSGCGGDEPIKQLPEIALSEQQLVAPASAAHSNCGDHSDDDTHEVREQAARTVTWRNPKKAKKGATVQAKILGFNDFHGQLSEGRRVANRPVGGAAVMASYLKAAQVGFEGKALIADSQRAAMGTDFGFMNPGGIRQNLSFAAAPGNAADADGVALWGELFTIQPFGNSLVKLNMTGQQIYDLLNQQFAVNRFLQISGLTYTWDNALPASSRVVEVRKDGVAIDKLASYTVTANNFIATGGDGFTVFLSGTGNVGGPIDLDALIAYLGSLTQPCSAPALNRITRLN